MPKFRQHNVTAARWSANGDSLGTVDLTEASSYPFGENVFSPASSASACRRTSATGSRARSRRVTRSTRRSPTRSRAG